MENEEYDKEKELSNNPKSISFEALEFLIPKAKSCLCKIECNDGGHGTGFFCNISEGWNPLKVLITNNHVLNEENISLGKQIKFSINNEMTYYKLEIDESRKVFTDKDYDLTIIEICKNDKLDKISFFDIDERIFKENPDEIFRNIQIYLLHYPKGNKMEYSIGFIKNIDNYIIRHSCDSNNGSSGGPLINSINFQVIGIHKGAPKGPKNYNLGTFLKEPLEKFKEKNENNSYNKNKTLEEKCSLVIKKEKGCKKKTFLDPERAGMISSVLSKISLDILDICDAIEQYDLKILTKDICYLLLPIMPNEEEIKEVSTFNGDLLKDLAFCDQFVLLIAGIIGFKERIKSILFKYNYIEDYLIIIKEMNRVFKVFNFLKEDKNFQKFLEVILSKGNFMKGGSLRDGAYDYSLISLLKFSETESNGNALIDYTVKFIYEQKQEVKIFDILEKLKKFDKIDYQSIVKGVKQMENRWKDVQHLKKIISVNKDQLFADDKSESFLNDFYNDAEEKIKEIKRILEKIDKDYEDIIKFYGEKSDKFTLIQFVETFCKLRRDLFKSEKKFKEKL